MEDEKNTTTADESIATEERREYMRDYMKLWRKTHKERIHDYNVKYWKRRAEARKGEQNK